MPAGILAALQGAQDTPAALGDNFGPEQFAFRASQDAGLDDRTLDPDGVGAGVTVYTAAAGVVRAIRDHIARPAVATLEHPGEKVIRPGAGTGAEPDRTRSPRTWAASAWRAFTASHSCSDTILSRRSSRTIHSFRGFMTLRRLWEALADRTQRRRFQIRRPTKRCVDCQRHRVLDVRSI
jgi:hypothetical protein